MKEKLFKSLSVLMLIFLFFSTNSSANAFSIHRVVSNLLNKKTSQQVEQINSEEDIQLSTWMSDYKDKIGSIPLTKISIPGTHDSGTYSLKATSKVADGDSLPEILNLTRIGRGVVSRWSKTQNLSIAKQLNQGIRYLDLRVSLYKKDGQLYLCHGLNCNTVEYELKEIKDFLEAHKGEVVVLDFNHFYLKEDKDVDSFLKYLKELIRETFRGKLALKSEFNKSLANITLNSMEAKNLQVIVLFHGNVKVKRGSYEKGYAIIQDEDFMWGSNCIDSKWMNTSKYTTLTKKLLEYHQGPRVRDSRFSVIQYVLTPDASYIKGHFLSSLKRMTKDAINGFQDFWKSLQNVQTNIFMMDFPTAEICKIIIRKNPIN